jgi:hypothetical protein
MSDPEVFPGLQRNPGTCQADDDFLFAGSVRGVCAFSRSNGERKRAAAIEFQVALVRRLECSRVSGADARVEIEPVHR